MSASPVAGRGRIARFEAEAGGDVYNTSAGQTEAILRGSMAKVARKPVTIYSDGACSGNPGPGGYGVILDSQGHRKEISGGYRRTTNNRMELMGAIVGLEALKEPCSVTLVTDSQYVVNGIEKGWAARWRARGWMRNAKERALNPDLWQRLLDQVARHEVRFRWIRGHAGHAENERCDALAVAAASRSDLQEDRPSPS